MIKILTMGASSLLGVALLGFQPPEPDGPPGAPPPPLPPLPKKKADGGPAGDLRKAYELLRRIRSEGRSAGRPEERLRDWTDRASRLYRDGVKAFESRDFRRAHEYGTAAHDLARAVDHSRNASVYEERDSDLPPPPGAGPGGNAGRVRGDLWRAHDRIRAGLDAEEGDDTKFYLQAARDLYNAARRDAESGRNERAGELARAAEAITHVSEHLARAGHEGDAPPPPPEEGGALRKETLHKQARPPIPKAKRDAPPPPPDGDDGPRPKTRRNAPPLPPLPPEPAETPTPPRPPRVRGDGPEPRGKASPPPRLPLPPGGGPEATTDQRRDELPPPL